MIGGESGEQEIDGIKHELDTHENNNSISSVKHSYQTNTKKRNAEENVVIHWDELNCGRNIFH